MTDDMPYMFNRNTGLNRTGVIAGALMLAVSLSGAPAAVAQDAGATPVALQEELADLTMEETLLLPQVPQKQKQYIKEYMLREARALQKLGYTVETMRQGEVVVATVPCGRLFLPNDTTLMPSAGNELKHFLPYFRTPGKFKVILAVHSDDTGSEPYLYSLTEKRVLALYDYFDAHAAQTENLMGYPLGPSEPRSQPQGGDFHRAWPGACQRGQKREIKQIYNENQQINHCFLPWQKNSKTSPSEPTTTRSGTTTW